MQPYFVAKVKGQFVSQLYRTMHAQLHAGGTGFDSLAQ
jgi:hypothetical protein